MKILYRKDLNMPRGKIIAQASHALSGFVLGCFDFNQFAFKTSALQLLTAIQTVELGAVSDQEFEAQEGLVTIEDHGRTVFGGVPTVTCKLIVEADLAQTLNYAPNPHILDESPELDIRLVHIIDKAYARANFDLAMQQAVVLQARHLVSHMQNPIFAKSSAFLQWASGSFAKIVLISKDDYLAKISENVQISGLAHTWQKNVEGQIQSLVLGPDCKANLVAFTDGLKMM